MQGMEFTSKKDNIEELDNVQKLALCMCLIRWDISYMQSAIYYNHEFKLPTLAVLFVDIIFTL